MSSDPTRRFSDRALHYAQWRPRYPAELIEFFKTQFNLPAGATIADAGSGTGLLTELLLQLGGKVFAVEPNAEMRSIAEKNLGNNSSFRSANATAEATTLADESVDLITAGQAFHWFDRSKTKVEFARILKPGGWVALVWNERRSTETAFGDAYQTMIHDFRGDASAESYRTLTSGNRQAFTEFFGSGGFQIARFDNHQTMDLQGLCGRVLSTSSMPLPGHPKHEALMKRLAKIFERFQDGGVVRIEYDTRVYYGHIS